MVYRTLEIALCDGGLAFAGAPWGGETLPEATPGAAGRLMTGFLVPGVSYGDETPDETRLAGIVFHRSEGDGSLRNLRNAAVSLGHVVDLDFEDEAHAGEAPELVSGLETLLMAGHDAGAASFQPTGWIALGCACHADALAPFTPGFSSGAGDAPSGGFESLSGGGGAARTGLDAVRLPATTGQQGAARADAGQGNAAGPALPPAEGEAARPVAGTGQVMLALAAGGTGEPGKAAPSNAFLREFLDNEPDHFVFTARDDISAPVPVQDDPFAGPEAVGPVAEPLLADLAATGSFADSFVFDVPRAAPQERDGPAAAETVGAAQDWLVTDGGDLPF